MSTRPPIQYQGPKISPKVPWEIRIHLQQFYSKLGNHTQAFGLVSSEIAKVTGKAQTIIQQVAGGGGGGSVPAVVGVGTVNDQTGQTAYTTATGDNGALIILSDASPIALTLAGGSLPYFVMVANIGAGLATLTPATPPSGTSTISYASNPAASSMPLPTGNMTIVAFNGQDWFAAIDVLAQTYTLVPSQWLDSYDATTGLFTSSQPAFTDISGTLSTAQLPASVPVVSFGVGAPGGTSSEGFIYFDTTGSPYHGYVWHSGAWNIFS